MATINTAESYGFPFGRIQPGASADLVCLSDLKDWDVEAVEYTDVGLDEWGAP